MLLHGRKGGDIHTSIQYGPDAWRRGWNVQAVSFMFLGDEERVCLFGECLLARRHDRSHFDCLLLGIWIWVCLLCKKLAYRAMGPVQISA